MSADTSQYGLEGVIEQLVDTESCRVSLYSNWKEALALTWSRERFSGILIGKQFKFLTDHKPLVQIRSNKPVDELSGKIIL